MNQLTLDLAATSFFGADIGPEVEDINRAFVDMVAVAITPTPPPLPGRQMARVVNGRKRIVAYFREQIPLHRRQEGGEASSRRIRTGRAGCATRLRRSSCRPTHRRGLTTSRMPLSEMAFREALRIKPPVPSMPRRRDARLHVQGLYDRGRRQSALHPSHEGHLAGAGSFRSTALHRGGAARSAPLRLDTFGGGGAHMCLGLHAGGMLCAAFLQNLEVSLEPNYKPDWQMWPIRNRATDFGW
jgi:hypothetical protein